jgi:hypothetical protein
MRTRLEQRRELVALFGGACQICGYAKCLRALQFHHVDPTYKKEWLRGTTTSVKEVAAHPERFRLLCANCHFEEHERLDKERVTFAKCLHCGKEFRTTDSRTKTGRSRYCSRACMHLARTPIAIANIENRFWKFVQKTDTCWNWTSVQIRGRAVMQIKGTNGKYTCKSVHRLSYELHFGLIPAGRNVKQTCGNHLCVNPKHLLLS